MHRYCPCQTAKKFISSVLKLVDNFDGSVILSLEEFEKAKRDLIRNSQIYKSNRHLYENSNHTKTEKQTD